VAGVHRVFARWRGRHDRRSPRGKLESAAGALADLRPTTGGEGGGLGSLEQAFRAAVEVRPTARHIGAAQSPRCSVGVSLEPAKWKPASTASAISAVSNRSVRSSSRLDARAVTLQRARTMTRRQYVPLRCHESALASVACSQPLCSNSSRSLDRATPLVTESVSAVAIPARSSLARVARTDDWRRSRHTQILRGFSAVATRSSKSLE
jgi:hypothetical protein